MCTKVGCKGSLRFASNAIRLRHEREAHNGTIFYCSYEGCKRSEGNRGFPRSWNLRDHKRRAHNDPGSPPSCNGGTKSKKRKAAKESDEFSPLSNRRTKGKRCKADTAEEVGKVNATEELES